MTRIYAIALGLSSTLLTVTSAVPSVAQTAVNGQFMQNRGEVIFQNPVNRSAGANYQSNPSATGQRPAAVHNSAVYQRGERLREFSSYGQPSGQPSIRHLSTQSVDHNFSYQNSANQNQVYQTPIYLNHQNQANYQNQSAYRQLGNQTGYRQPTYQPSASSQPIYQPSAYSGQSRSTAAVLSRPSQSTARVGTTRVTTETTEAVGSEPTATVSTAAPSAASPSSATETETAFVRPTPRLESPVTPAYDASVIDYFLEIAMGAEFNNSAEVVRKWESDLRIRVNGNPTAADLQTLHSIVDEINGMNLTIRMQIVDQNPNVEMYFVPEQQFSRYEPNYRPVNMGYAWVRWSNYRISSANILISTTGVNQQERSHLIREELTQAMGLLQDSYRYPDSIFYQGWTDTTAYTALDRKVIQLLYSPMIQAGMSRAQVTAALNSGSNTAGRLSDPSVSPAPAPLRSRF